MSSRSDLAQIPGTYVMTPEHSRMGYRLNMFCKTLDIPANRAAFRADPEAYLDRFDLPEAQRNAVVARDWLGLLRLGGSVYYTFKIAAFDGLSMQAMGGAMSGQTEAEFRQMMINGGRRQGDLNT